MIRKESLIVQQNQGMTAHQPRRQHHPRSDARPRPLQWKEVGPSQPPLGLACINDELLESPRNVARSGGTPPQEPCCPGPGLLGDRFCAGFSLGQQAYESLRVDHLPPTSHSRTTSLAWPKCPVSSGYVLSFLRPAVRKAAPSSRTPRRCGRPSRLTEDISAVWIAN